MTDIKTKLAAWGAWVRSDRDKLGYHSNYERILSLAPEHDAKDAQKRSNLPFMSDCEAMMVSAAMVQLKRRSSRFSAAIGTEALENINNQMIKDMMVHRIVCDCYIKSKSYRDIADAINSDLQCRIFNKVNIAELIKFAHGYIEGKMEAEIFEC